MRYFKESRHILCILILSFSLSACSIFDDDDPGNDNYIGSLPIKDEDSLPFGLTADGSGGFIVTARGPGTTSDPDGRIFGISTNDEEFSRSKISAKPVGNFSRLSGSFFDPSTSRLYVCSNPVIASLPPSVVVFERANDGSFLWKTSSNFSSSGQYCHSVTKSRGYLFATNSRSPTSMLVETALYSLKLDDDVKNIPASMAKSITYAEIGYKKGDMDPGSDLVTGVTSSSANVGSESVYLVDTRRNNLFLITFVMMPSVFTATKLELDEDVYSPVAIAQNDINSLIVSENNSGNPRLKEIYYDNIGKPHSRVIAHTSSPVSAIDFGPDYFDKTSDKVVFALLTEPKKGIFYVDEFSLAKN
ncbi:hypothetical protein [Candidatus Ichthyocystis hellenicum]|uniref:hypothetical protein n=1 Tax=Candidatus Ichthyocystis hellenicum TaxID=1561003 RepID=UPI000B85EB80|nr:hypothetical protein [Candidatus Ichthyocystis hellenicum]